jgi:hypothetical protein
MTAERSHHNCCERARHDRNQDATVPRCLQGLTKHDDREHGAKSELQSDRLVNERQSRDDDAVGSAARQSDGARACERQRHREQRQRRRTEQVRPGGVRRERDTERQQRNQHRDHQPALRPAAAEQHHSRDQREGAEIDRRREPAQSECGREVMAGDEPHQFTGEAPAYEAERVVDGVVRHPIHVERNDIDCEAQYGRRPDRNGHGRADVQQRASPLTRGLTQDHHQMRPNEQW